MTLGWLEPKQANPVCYRAYTNATITKSTSKFQEIVVKWSLEDTRVGLICNQCKVNESCNLRIENHSTFLLFFLSPLLTILWLESNGWCSYQTETRKILSSSQIESTVVMPTLALNKCNDYLHMHCSEVEAEWRYCSLSSQR